GRGPCQRKPSRRGRFRASSGRRRGRLSRERPPGRPVNGPPARHGPGHGGARRSGWPGGIVPGGIPGRWRPRGYRLRHAHGPARHRPSGRGPAAPASFGSLQICGDVSNWSAAGRVQHLAQLNTAMVQLTQALEDERDLSAGYAAAFPDRAAGAGSAVAGRLTKAQNATTADVSAVNALAGGVDTAAGYQLTTVQDLTTLTDSLQDLRFIRHVVTTSAVREAKIIQVYTNNIITPANTFSGAAGAGANDAELQGNVTTLGALLRLENEMSVQRAAQFDQLL